MAKQTINIGASPNDGTGTPLRTSFDYCNLNFTELYTATGPSGNNIVCPGSGTFTGALGATGLNVTGATIPANGVYLGSANNLSFSAASTLGMTLDSTGLGVGASPSTKLTVGAASPTLRLLDTNTAVNNGVYGTIDWLSSDSSMPGGLAAKIDVIDTATAGDRGAMRFFTNDGSSLAERLRIDAAGNLLVGTTGPLAGNAAKLHLSTNSGTTRWAVGPYSDPNNFIVSAVGGSGVYLNGTAATSWTSASDERLKDIIEPISNAVSKIASLRAVIGKFKFDENNTRKPFLIAQDIQAVLPEAVDASNPDRLGVAYTDVIPLLVAAIKELTARVQTLEAK